MSSLNIFWSYTLIFGKFGFSPLGIAGAGWGMTISYWSTFIFLVIYLMTQKSYTQYLKPIIHFKQYFEKPSFFFELIKVGFPIGIMYGLEIERLNNVQKNSPIVFKTVASEAFQVFSIQFSLLLLIYQKALDHLSSKINISIRFKCYNAN